MKVCVLPLILMAVIFAGCDVRTARTPSGDGGEQENIDPAERAAAAKLKPAKDPVSEEIWAAKLKTREAFNNRRFDALEKEASGLRATKELYGNGSWKIVAFYEAIECSDDDPKSRWELHDRIYQEWIAAQPESITARIAYAEFLADYAWQARGSG